MKVLKLKDKKVAERLQERFLKKKRVVAVVGDEKEAEKLRGKSVDVVIVLESLQVPVNRTED